jgi:hypothetical protein
MFNWRHLFTATIEDETVYPYPPERVWRAFIEDDDGPSFEDPTVGETIELSSGSPDSSRATLVEYNQHEKLTVSVDNGGTMPSFLPGCEITWSFKPVEDGTRLITSMSFKGLRGTILLTVIDSDVESMFDQDETELLRALEADDPRADSNTRHE